MNDVCPPILRYFSDRSPVACCVLASGVFAAALALRLMVLPADAGLQFVTFYPALTLATLVAGARCGLLVTGMSVFSAYFFFMVPYAGLKPVQPLLPGLLTFTLSAVFMVWFLDRVVAYGGRQHGLARELQEAKAALEEDVARREQAERAARESEARFRDILEHAPIGMAIVGLDGRFLQVNRALCESVGYDKLALEALSFQDITHPDDLAADLANVKQLLEGAIDSYAMHKRYIARDGRVIWIKLTGSVRRSESGAPLYFIAQIQDVSQERALEEERANHLLHVSNLSRRLVSVQEDERRRLAGIVDDMLSPNLAAVQLYLAGVAAHMPEHPSRTLDAQLADTRALVADTASRLSDLSADLRPVLLDFAGLYPAVEGYAMRFALRTGIPVDVLGTEPPQRLPPDLESLLFRIAQEALDNCARHASAGRVIIELDHDDRNARLSIVDDGVGFALNAGPGEQDAQGLISMRERAEFAGGRLMVETASGQGTRILVEI